MKKQNNISDALHAKVLKRLIKHLQNRCDVQNIDLMILSGFCRNCIAKWYVQEADSSDSISLDDARELVYGMDYNLWKEKHQTKCTKQQLEQYEKIKPKH